MSKISHLTAARKQRLGRKRWSSRHFFKGTWPNFLPQAATSLRLSIPIAWCVEKQAFITGPLRNISLNPRTNLWSQGLQVHFSVARKKFRKKALICGVNCSYCLLFVYSHFHSDNGLLLHGKICFQLVPKCVCWGSNTQGKHFSFQLLKHFL